MATTETITEASRETTALRRLHLSMLGTQIADREGYDVEGLQAIYHFLFQKHGLLPEYSDSLSTDALSLLLAEELHGWTVPDEAMEGDRAVLYAIEHDVILAEIQLGEQAERYGTKLAGDRGWRCEGRWALEFHLVREFGMQSDRVDVMSSFAIWQMLQPEIEAWERLDDPASAH